MPAKAVLCELMHSQVNREIRCDESSALQEAPIFFAHEKGQA